MKILVVVGSENCEIQFGRKGKGSLAMSFSQGLVDPNRLLNRLSGKGNRLIFLYRFCIRGNASLSCDALG